MPCHHWGVTFTLDKKTAENQCSLIGSEFKSLAQTKKKKKGENYMSKKWDWMVWEIENTLKSTCRASEVR